MSVFDAGTLDAGHWSAGLRLTYTRPDQRSDDELEALAGKHIHAHNSTYNLVGAIGAAYGVTHRLTISAQLPYVRRDKIREGIHSHLGGVTLNGVERLGSVAGVGDATVLAKYRLTKGAEAGLAILVGIKLPTGSTHRRSLDGERLETEHQPGTGSWDPIIGASASVPAGSFILAASGLYQISTNGAQDTRLGDRFQGGIALSHRFGSRGHVHQPSHHHHHGDELDEHDGAPQSSWTAFVELGGEWEGRQRVAGEVETESGGGWAWLAPGVRFNAASGWSASAALAIPVYQRIRASHPDNRYRVTLSVGRAF
jgi:hypothetical protein